MSSDMNLVILIGNLGETPIVRSTSTGKQVTTFSLATTERWKDANGVKQERTTWHKVQAWGAHATTCATYLKKGSKLRVTGRNDVQPWTDKDGVKRNPTIVVMQEMGMMGDPGYQQGPHTTNVGAGQAPDVPAPPAPQATPVAVPPPPAPAGPTYNQMIAGGWSPEQMAADPRFAHLVPAPSNPQPEYTYAPPSESVGL